MPDRDPRRDRFLRACRREPVDCTPVWLMRQAGRYLPEYQALRARHSFMELVKTPELAAEVTLQPVERLGVDAAILFADILLPLEPMGLDVAITHERGPVIANPVRRLDDARALGSLDPEEDLAYVLETIRIVRRELDGRIPLIGFAGAPFTLACYVVEGGTTREYRRCKEMMWAAPEAWDALMSRLAEATVQYLRAQAAAGAQALQLFDSWAGALAPEDYRRHVLPYSRRVIDGIRGCGVPVIHFALNAGSFLEAVAEAGGDVIGVDWRTGLGEARRRLGPGVALQGNLDPIALFAPLPAIEEKVRHILAEAAGTPGHIFNLGHGIHRETPVEHAIALIEMVHRLSARGSGETLQGEG